MACGLPCRAVVCGVWAVLCQLNPFVTQVKKPPTISQNAQGVRRVATGEEQCIRPSPHMQTRCKHEPQYCLVQYDPNSRVPSVAVGPSETIYAEVGVAAALGYRGNFHKPGLRRWWEPAEDHRLVIFAGIWGLRIRAPLRWISPTDFVVGMEYLRPGVQKSQDNHTAEQQSFLAPPGEQCSSPSVLKI